MIVRLALIAQLALAIHIGVPSPAAAQDMSNPEKVAKLVARAIRSADARELAGLSAGQVELDLGQGTSTYSRDQARYVFSSFFEEHPPSDFSLGDVSVLKGLCTARGRYVSHSSNQPWDAFIRLGSSSGEWRLKEVRLSHGLSNQLPSALTPQLPPRIR